LRIFADYAAIALTNARAFAQIEELRRKLEAENEYLREEVESGAGSAIVGSSPALRQVLDQISLVGPTDATVLIQGEFGSDGAVDCRTKSLRDTPYFVPFAGAC
jgi:transcriptional regulator with GAF, ATPase, and Fis domain